MHLQQMTFDTACTVLQANVKEPELYQLCDRVKQIRAAVDNAEDGHKAEMQQQLAEPKAASQ